MKEYSVYIKAMVIKEYIIDCYSKEEAMEEALSVFNEAMTDGYVDFDSVETVSMQVEEWKNDKNNY